MGQRLIAHSLFVILTLLSASFSDAAINNWTNPAGGSWETAGNWSDGAVPDSSDTVQIGVSGTYSVTLGSSAVNSFPTSLTNTTLRVFSFGSGTPTLDVNFTNAATLQVNGPLSIGNGVMNVNTPNGGVSIAGYPNGLYMGEAAYGLNGTLNVNAGNFNAGGFLILASAAGSTSTVNVNTGGTFFSNFGRIGNNGTAQINVNGGTLSLGSQIVGYSAGATGRIVVANGSLYVTNGNALGIGSGDNNSANHGYGQLILSNSSFFSAGFYSWLTIGSGVDAAGGGGVGDMQVYGGTHTNVAYVIAGGSINSTGTILLSGANWTGYGAWLVGANSNAYGRVTMDSGILRTAQQYLTLKVGSYNHSKGEFNLTGGDVLLDYSIGSPYDNWIEVGGGQGSTGVVHVTGGRIKIQNSGIGLLIGRTYDPNTGIVITNTTGAAQVILDGGRVELYRITTLGNGILSNRTGGVLQFLGADIISGSPSSLIVDGGTLSYKNYSALNVTGAVAKFNIVSGSGLQLESSTNLNLTGTYTLNNAAGSFKELSLAGTNTLWRSDSLQINAGTRLHVTNAVNARLSGAITNAGTIFVQNSTVTYQNPVNISGRYISDPSTNTFSSNVTVAVSGTLEGGIGDLFDFKKSLLVNSTNNLGFNLASSVVRFSGGGNHTNAVTGGDFGTNYFPEANFSYGRLSLASSTDHVYFASGGFDNGSASNALYVRELDLLASTNLVANLHSSFNVYYLLSEHATFNTYLNDQTYALNGGGFLMPVVPEPSALAMLLVSGMLLGWGLRRKR